MATELEIRVTAELSQIRTALAQLTRSIDQVGTRANASAANGRALTSSLDAAARQARRTADGADALRTKLAGAVSQAKLLVGGLGILGTAKVLVDMADTATRLAGQIRLVTKSTDEFNTAQAATFAIAQRTRQTLQGTVDLYARIARTGRTTQQQTLALTESINQAVALSFTTAQASEAALFQLGQGLGSGVLRGEELNSVLEQTPRLAQAIAQGLVALGKIDSTTQLRKFANDGKLSAELVTRAIITQQKTLREEFAKLQPTVADAFTALKNAALQFVGQVNQAHGASRQLADGLLFLARNIDVLAGAIITATKLWAGYFLAFRVAPVAIGALVTALTFARNAAALATPAMRALAAQAVALQGGFGIAAQRVTQFNLALTGSQLIASTWAVRMKAAFALAFAALAGWQIGSYLRDQFLEVQLFGIALAQGLHKVAVEIGAGFRATGAVIVAVFRNSFNSVKTFSADLLDTVAKGYDALPGRLGAGFAALARSNAASIRSTITQTEGVADAFRRVRAETLAELAKIDAGYSDLADAAIKAKQTTAEAIDQPTDGGTDTTKAIGGIVDKFALMKDAAERALAALDQLYADAGVTIADYYREKVRLQQAAIDADIAAAERDAANAKTSQERSAALTQLIILERQRRDVATQAVHDQKKAEEDLTRQLGEVHIKLLALQGQGARARSAELEEQYRDLILRLEREADTAGLALVRKLINLEASKAGLDQLKQQYSDVTGALSQLEQTTAAQISAGLLSNATGEARLADARAKALEQLKAQRQAVADLYNTYKDPAVLVQLQALDQQIAQLSVSTDDWRGKTQDATQNSLNTFFDELIDGAHTAGEAVRDLAVNFTQSLGRMAAEAVSKKATNAIFDLFTKDKAGADGGTNAASDVATAAAAGLAYSTPVTTAATALGLAGSTVASGATALAVSAAQLQVAANTLLIANSASVAGAAHTGGVVGALYQAKRVAPFVFAGAPRYHTGGIAGLAPDEVPTVLRRGEEVLTRQDPRHRFNGGLGRDAAEQGTGRLRLILLDDHRRVADYLNSGDGDQVLVQRIGANAGAIRELLVD